LVCKNVLTWSHTLITINEKNAKLKNTFGKQNFRKNIKILEFLTSLHHEVATKVLPMAQLQQVVFIPN
jgi:hypothetical protein